MTQSRNPCRKSLKEVKPLAIRTELSWQGCLGGRQIGDYNSCFSSLPSFPFFALAFSPSLSLSLAPYLLTAKSGLCTSLRRRELAMKGLREMSYHLPRNGGKFQWWWQLPGHGILVDSFSALLSANHCQHSHGTV